MDKNSDDTVRAGTAQAHLPPMVAVVGATGFLGNAVVRALNRAGYSVRALSRSGASVEGAAESAAIPALPGDENFASLFEGCYGAVNCAARVHVTDKEDAQAALPLYRAVNRDLALALAKGARTAGVKRFVQVSTVAAITSSSEPGRPVDDHTPETPASPYGISKAEADAALAEIGDEEMGIVSIRPPAIYGPGVRAWFAMLNRAAQKGLPLPVGGIANARSFAFVDNVADAIIAALHSNITGRYIVTDSEPVSTAELYRLLLSLHGKPDRAWRWPGFVMRGAATVVLRDRAQSLLGDAAYDGSRFRRDTGWSPPHAMEEGLALTVAAG